MTRILLRGGYVHTPADPHATALCVEDGTIVWTGDDDASVHFADNADRIVELDGRLVTPAFVDAHAHLAQTGFAAASVDLTGVASLHEALDALAAHTRTTSSPVCSGFGLGRDRLARAAAVHPRGGRPGHGRPPGLPRPGRRALRRGQHRVPRRLPRDGARRGVRRQRARLARRAPPGPRGTVPAAAALRARGRDPARAPGRRPARASAWSTSSARRTSARPRTSRSPRP